MDKDDIFAESGLENLDKLRGEGDFGDEENGRGILSVGALGKRQVDVRFARAGDAVE